VSFAARSSSSCSVLVSYECQFYASAFTVLQLVQFHVGVGSQCVVYVYCLMFLVACLDESKVIPLGTEAALPEQSRGAYRFILSFECQQQGTLQAGNTAYTVMISNIFIRLM